jgi:iron-sulfur cluster repair protein YtfE (RIC family)
VVAATDNHQQENAMLAESMIDTNVTVRETMARHPESKDVFTRFGVDTCCGSGVPITDAAHRDGADLDELVKALREAMAG